MLSGASTEPTSATSTTSYMSVLRLLPGLLLIIGGGAAGVIYLYGLSYEEAIYYAASTATTQGYGDFRPHGRMQMLVMIPYMWLACGGFFALAEQAYLVARGHLVQRTSLKKVVDQLLLQPSPWDTSVGGVVKSHVLKADLGEGLSEAEFLLAVLVGHGVVDVPTLITLRRQFAQLMRTAHAHDPRHATATSTPSVTAGGTAADAPAAAATGASAASSVAGEQRLDAYAVFAIGLAEHTIQHRPEDSAVGSTNEANVNSEGVSVMPTALVDLRAADGGFGEWHEHFWLKRLAEVRANAAGGAAEAEAAPSPAKATPTNNCSANSRGGTQALV